MHERPNRRSRMLFGPFVALILTLAGALAGMVALTVAATPASGASRCPASVADGQVRVAIVVDSGTEPDSPGGLSVECFVMPSGSTGADLLHRRASSVGTANPRYNASGLLCAIDGFPSSGCGQQVGSLYRYWSYWSGSSGSWAYGTGNPFSRRLKDGDIEGWRFQAGHANPSDSPPRVAPDPAAFFPAGPPPAASADEGSGPGAGAASGGGGPSGATVGPSGQVDGGNATGPDTATPDPASGSVEGQSGAAVDGESAQGSGSDPDNGQSTTGPDDTSNGTSTEELAAQTTGSSSGPPVGLLVGAGAIVVLGVASIVQFRRGAQR